MIGDPSGKSEERPMRAVEDVAHNAELIWQQIQRVATNALGADGLARFAVRNNAEWLSGLGLVEFLRDTGKHFTVNWMMHKDSVKTRMETGISFTEFSYMLLQAYDFSRMYQNDGVTLQLGGSDQWGNITAGTELVRRTQRGEAHGLTFPLLTDAQGKKFGKTEAGAVYLDGQLTRVYEFYQFWINAEDADVGRLLRTFTLLDQPAIEGIEAAQAAAPHERAAQKRLAREVTSLIHGAAAAELAETVSRTVFDKKADAHALSDEVFTMLAAEMPSVAVTPSADGVDVVEVLAQAFALSRTAARKLVQQGAVSVNGTKLGAEATHVAQADAVRERWMLVRKGAREIAVVEMAR
jgi:tyrosyl-tRNA synthetase